MSAARPDEEPPGKSARSRRGGPTVLLRRESATRVPVRRLQRAVRATLEREGRHAGEVSVLIVDDRAMAALNGRWRGRRRPTDVLAFPQRNGVLIGDIVLSAETARRQAAEYSHTLADELELLAVHGALHLCGWRDGTLAARSRMRRRERVILRALAIPAARQ